MSDSKVRYVGISGLVFAIVRWTTVSYLFLTASNFFTALFFGALGYFLYPIFIGYYLASLVIPFMRAHGFGG